ncbi:ParB N-terminal domain-containing protein [Vibrio owensii]|uniref:ParB N-terminal domain-containing protein n=1 Tax=Vibrio owensii TaxID=696485 RepID=UPI0018F1F544|nr:ParB N-terminal domain-containing protein [Vibrio owensii]
MSPFYPTRRKSTTPSPEMTKTFTLPGGLTTQARRVVVPADKLKDLAMAHPLNPRHQEALTEDSLADILPSIRESGVITEGIAEEVEGKFLLLDSSRRMAAALIANKDLPLWVFDKDLRLTRRQAEYITEIARMQRNLSYREEGTILIKAMAEKSELNDIQALMQEFRYQPSQERTVRRYLDAAVIPEEIINLFPDSEGIPNDFYAKLKAICKEVARLEKIKQAKEESVLAFFKRIEPIISEWIKGVKNVMSIDEELPVHERQQQVLTKLSYEVYGAPKKTAPETWSQAERLFNRGKWSYADIQRHKNGRELKIHTKQLTKEQESQLLNLIKSFG